MNIGVGDYMVWKDGKLVGFDYFNRVFGKPILKDEPTKIHKPPIRRNKHVPKEITYLYDFGKINRRKKHL